MDSEQGDLLAREGGLVANDAAGADVAQYGGQDTVDAARDATEDSGAVDSGTVDATADSGTVDAAEDATEDSGTVDTAGDTAQDSGPGPPGEVICGAQVCAPGDTCCWQTFQQLHSCAAECTGLLNTPILCDGPEDCPGELCCFEISGVKCGQSCTGPTVCRTSAVCPPSAAYCCPSGLGDLLVCRNNAC